MPQTLGMLLLVSSCSLTAGSLMYAMLLRQRRGRNEVDDEVDDGDEVGDGDDDASKNDEYQQPEPQGQPQLNCKDGSVRQQILDAALQRAVTSSSVQQELSFTLITASHATTTPLKNQVGGLGNDTTNKKTPLLSMPPDYVLKPVQLKQYRGFREIAFYESLQVARVENKTLDETVDDTVEQEAVAAAAGTDTTQQEMVLNDIIRRRKKEVQLLQRLARFTASYYGVIQLSPQELQLSKCDRYYIVLQDITAASHPDITDTTGQQQQQQQHSISISHSCNVMDLKMGTQTFEPDAALEKKQREAAKYRQQVDFGFRLVGMRKYYHDIANANHAHDNDTLSVNSKGYHHKTWDKLYGRSLTTRAALVDAFGEFFYASVDALPQLLCTEAIESIQMQLQSLQEWFEDNDVLSFYSSSILLVFDEHGDETKADLRMVDFGHVRRGHGGDGGYMFGLQTLSSVLQELLERKKDMKDDDHSSSDGSRGHVVTKSLYKSE
eukprot:CAMPEP_0119011548 /NCGR_PEP_ID=MMETSP1176-20130426/5747_1 /TAXON_ID=265551 /ORGANISM="Synedropsis recta cf, Strain CCMP1620" /LENGTH=493 /DNA_ID=CAMNT_0006964395 /DNA_START=56 /DNA_END=1534 /DNA_ORIENTATION=+